MSPGRMTTLEAIENTIWRELQAAAHDAGHGWRFAVLATSESGHPQARTVVLREVERDERLLLFYTDARSAKVKQLQAHPDAVLVMWSQPLSWQLRLQVRFEVLTEGLAVSSRWAQLALTPSAQDYLAPLPPGSPIDTHEPLRPDRGSRGHFAMLQAQVQAIDWLELHAEGHRRAAFDGARKQWLAP